MTLPAEAAAFLGKLKTEAPHLVDEFLALFHHEETQAETDATTLEHQAEGDLAPVVHAAETDAEQLAQTAAADAHQSAPAAAPTTDEKPATSS